MSSAYLFTPSSYHSFQPTPYVDPYKNTPQNSPYIPDLSLYPSSPYHSPHPSQPNTPLPRYVHFGDEPWAAPPMRRPRRPSWHAGMAVPSSPAAYSTQYLYPPPVYSHHRRHSFGTSPYTPWTPFPPASPWHYAQPLPPQFQIHPFLNAESPRPDFFFDVSHPHFAPSRLVGPGQSVHLSPEELRQPATHPPITRLRIICDAIPQWPIDLQYNPYFNGGVAPHSPDGGMLPITLCDVLVAVHRSLHTRISHIDWARLSVAEETAVSKAYTRRCRSVPSTSEFEANQGVRRVDYLLDRVIFRGLLRVSSSEGFETMRLILGDRA
jgi:hypothetical protein